MSQKNPVLVQNQTLKITVWVIEVNKWRNMCASIDILDLKYSFK